MDQTQDPSIGNSVHYHSANHPLVTTGDCLIWIMSVKVALDMDPICERQIICLFGLIDTVFAIPLPLIRRDHNSAGA